MSSKTKNLRRNDAEGYEYKDGHSSSYAVYDDGRVRMDTGLGDAFNNIDVARAALHEFKQWMSDYMLAREREIQASIAKCWRDAKREMDILVPVPNPDEFELHYDRAAKILKRVAKPKPSDAAPASPTPTGGGE